MAERKIEVIITGANQTAPAFGGFTRELSAMQKATGMAGGALGSFANAFTAPVRAAGSLVDGLGKIGLAGLGIQSLTGAARGLAGALGVGLNSEIEQVTASLNAFTKDTAVSEQILADIRKEAALTPFAFNEMARATASLMPVAKQSGAALMDLVKEAEILAASNPLEGLEGASFSLREAMTGDFTSIIERFNLSRASINKLKAEGVPNLEIVRRAMAEMGFDSDLISAKAQTLEGRWSTFLDTIDTLRATISAPIFNALKEGLVGVQGALDANMPAIQGFADALAGRVAGAIEVLKGTLGIARAVFLAFTVDAGGMGLALDGVRKVFGDTVANAIQPFVQAFMEAIPAIKEFGDWMAAYFESFVIAVKRAFGGDLEGAVSSMSITLEGASQRIIGHLQNWAQAFIAWVGPMIPGLLGELGRLVPVLLNWFIESKLKQVEQLAGWAAAFIAWVQPMIPPFLTELGKVAAALLAWVQAKAPEVLERLQTWAQNFIAWVAPLIPGLLEQLQGVLLQMKDWIRENGPGLLKQFITEWVPNAINWVLQAAIDLVPVLAEFLIGIIKWIATEGPGILRTFIGEWVPVFIGWLAEAGVKIAPKLFEFIGTVTDWILNEAVPLLFQTAVQLGVALVQGIWAGLVSLDGWLRGKLVEFTQGWPEIVKLALGISSPSRVFAAIGEDIARGFAVGIDLRTDAAYDAATRLAMAARRGMAVGLADLTTVITAVPRVAGSAGGGSAGGASFGVDTFGRGVLALGTAGGGGVSGGGAPTIIVNNYGAISVPQFEDLVVDAVQNAGRRGRSF